MTHPIKPGDSPDTSKNSVQTELEELEITNHYLQKARSIFDFFSEQESDPDLFNHLMLLKKKRPNTTSNFSHSNSDSNSDSDLTLNTLNEPEAHELFRQERWNPHVYCPICRSEFIKMLSKTRQGSRSLLHYLCLVCNSEFSDTTQTPLDGGPNTLPIQIWMKCWYLYGTIQSIDYIAEKMNLPPELVKKMILELQKIFKTDKPFTRNLKYTDWEQSSSYLKSQLAESLQKMKELLQNADVGMQPKDTAEARKQKERRLDPYKK